MHRGYKHYLSSLCPRPDALWSYLLVYVHFFLCVLEATSWGDPAFDWQVLSVWPRSFDWQKNNGRVRWGQCAWVDAKLKVSTSDCETRKRWRLRENTKQQTVLDLTLPISICVLILFFSILLWWCIIFIPVWCCVFQFLICCFFPLYKGFASMSLCFRCVLTNFILKTKKILCQKMRKEMQREFNMSKHIIVQGFHDNILLIY